MGTAKRFRNLFVKGDLEVAGDATISGITITSSSATLIVESLSSLTTIGAVGDISSSGTITAKTGLASSSGTLDVDTSTFRGTITASSDLNVNNGITGSSDMLITGDINSSGTITAVTGLASSSGTLDVDTSTLRGLVTASSAVDINNTLTMSSGAIVPVETISTASSTTVSAYGITHFNGTGGSITLYELDTPVAGYTKDIINGVVSSNTTSYRVVRTRTGITINTSGAIDTQKIRLSGQGSAVRLVGLSASKWLLTSRTPTTRILASNSTTST